MIKIQAMESITAMIVIDPSVVRYSLLQETLWHNNNPWEESIVIYVRVQSNEGIKTEMKTMRVISLLLLQASLKLEWKHKNSTKFREKSTKFQSAKIENKSINISKAELSTFQSICLHLPPLARIQYDWSREILN